MCFRVLFSDPNHLPAEEQNSHHLYWSCLKVHVLNLLPVRWKNPQKRHPLKNQFGLKQNYIFKNLF